jgi:Predicted membrane protein (DUF2079)
MTDAVVSTRVSARQRRGREFAGPFLNIKRIGYLVLGIQLGLTLAWSTLLYNRFAVTFDFSIFEQAWTLIAHGHMDPFNTIKGTYFWQDHSEFFLWPLAVLYWIWPQGVVLLWLQDIAVVAAEAVAFLWLRQVAERLYPRGATWLTATGLLLLVANPWTWWALSWDFHSETTAMPFAVLLAWDLYNHRRRAWLWVVPLLASGDVAATYIAAIGVGAALASKRQRTTGCLLAAIGVVATVIITLVHGNLGSGGGLQAYGYLASSGPTPGHEGLGKLVLGIASHPGNVLSQLWGKRYDMWANLAPSGLPGFGYVWLLPMAVNILAANNLFAGILFAAPGFQSLPLYIFMPIGTVAVLAMLIRRHRIVAALLAGFVILEAIGYAVVWLPQTPSQWLRVSAPQAATLARIEAEIPASAEVFASQGIMGRFAGRLDIQSLFGPGPLPLQGGTAWFVIAPNAGIETMQPAAAMQLIAELAGPLHARLMADANGVWAFRWQPSAGARSFVVPNGNAPLAAWATPGIAGRAVMSGPVSTWHVAATGGTGYVADGLEWRYSGSRYQASVTLAASGPVNVEVWNDNCDDLIARRTVPSTALSTIVLPVNVTTSCRASAFSGWGPFRAAFIQPPAGQRLEIRVWSRGREKVNIYGAAISG